MLSLALLRQLENAFGLQAGASESDHLRWELAQTKKYPDEVRSALVELLAARRAREKAEAELAAFYRDRTS